MTLASVIILQNKNEGSQVINILRGATEGKVYYSFQPCGSVIVQDQEHPQLLSQECC